MIQPPIAIQKVPQTERPTLRILRSINDARYSCLLTRRQAHRAGLEGHNKSGAGEPPTLDSSRGGLERCDLRMPTRVHSLLAAIVATSDDSPIEENDRANRNFVFAR